MARIFISIAIVLAIIYIVPFALYAVASVFLGLKTPEGASPLMFLLSVFISKFGTAIAFTLFFYFARNSFSGHWLLYAFIWWLMFVIGEAGQAIGPHYSWKEAVIGVVSETIYFPLSAYVVDWLIKA